MAKCRTLTTRKKISLASRNARPKAAFVQNPLATPIQNETATKQPNTAHDWPFHNEHSMGNDSRVFPLAVITGRQTLDSSVT